MKAVALLLVLAAPTAVASGTVELGALGVSFDNGYERDCIEDHTGLCAATYTGDSPRNATIGLFQGLRSVTLRADDSDLEALTGAELLPDGALVIDFGDIRFEHPVFRLLVQEVGVVRGPGPAEDFAVLFTEERYGIEYLGPWTSEPTSIERRENLSGPYNEFAGYDHIGPMNYWNSQWTDREFRDAPAGPCIFLRTPECRGLANDTTRTLHDELPNVTFGVGIEQAEVIAGDPARVTGALDGAPLDGLDGLTRGLTRDAIGRRVSVEAQRRGRAWRGHAELREAE